MLEPPDGFSTSPQGHIFEIGTPEKQQQQQQQSNRSKDDMLNQYLNSYTSPQKRITAIGNKYIYFLLFLNHIYYCILPQRFSSYTTKEVI